MNFSSALKTQQKVGLARGVSIIQVDKELLLIKHNNKLFEISTESNVEIVKMFRVLEQPKKLVEIIKLLPKLAPEEIHEIIHMLYKHHLINFEGLDIKVKTSPNISENRRSLMNFNKYQKNKKLTSSKILLIGSGILADNLFATLKAIKINCDKIKLSSTISIKSKKKIEQIYAEKNKTKNKNKDEEILPPSLFGTDLNKYDLILVAEDYPNIALFESINKICFDIKKPWLRLSFDDNIGYLGPFVIPGKTSCFNCCELRLVTNSANYEYYLWRYKDYLPKANLTVPNLYADKLSTMCAKEVIRYVSGHKKPNTINALYICDTVKKSYIKHKLIFHPNCKYCRGWADIRIDPNFRLTEKRPSLSTSVKSVGMPVKAYSSLKDKELLRQLRDLVDIKTGIILEYEKLFENNPLGINFHHFSTATCSKPLRIGLRGQLTSFIEPEDSLIAPSPSGSGFTPTEAEIHTLMESVERYSSMSVDESRFIWATYNDVKHKAINPIDLGLYNDEQYDHDGFNCSRFSADSKIPWIMGQDLYSGNRVLIPADFVHYPAIRDKPLVRDTSNGSASHTNITQAILNGLYEVIERDAFLIMWLNKISMPILKIEKPPFCFSRSLKIIKDYGMSVKLVNLTNDTSVPTVMAVCYNDKGEYPALVVGTASHINSQKAVQKALFEMEFGLIASLEEPRQNITNPNNISRMYEHPIFYRNPSRHKNWDFMLSSNIMNRFPKFTDKFQDNKSVLYRLVKLLHKLNHRVVWVDTAPLDIRSKGLTVVKVFVTGFQPMYVGNKVRLNAERLFNVPVKLGYRSESQKYKSSLNFHPHPLP